MHFRIKGKNAKTYFRCLLGTLMYKSVRYTLILVLLEARNDYQLNKEYKRTRRKIRCSQPRLNDDFLCHRFEMSLEERALSYNSKL